MDAPYSALQMSQTVQERHSFNTQHKTGLGFTSPTNVQVYITRTTRPSVLTKRFSSSVETGREDVVRGKIDGTFTCDVTINAQLGADPEERSPRHPLKCSMTSEIGLQHLKRNLRFGHEDVKDGLTTSRTTYTNRRAPETELPMDPGMKVYVSKTCFGACWATCLQRFCFQTRCRVSAHERDSKPLRVSRGSVRVVSSVVRQHCVETVSTRRFNSMLAKSASTQPQAYLIAR